MSKYDDIGHGYAKARREDPSIARLIWAYLRNYRTVLNVGAGTGSYEPRLPFVVAVERSALMIRQRGQDAAPAVQADALRLPFPDNAFEASLAVLTIHHWKDWKLGVRELGRVSSKRVVLLTWFASHGEFWLHKFFPELLHADTGKFPTADQFAGILGSVEVVPVPIPHDCKDGFVGAYWRRPDAYLNQTVLNSMSTFHYLQHVDSGISALRKALADGSWHQEFGHLMNQSEADLGYRLVVSDKTGRTGL